MCGIVGFVGAARDGGGQAEVRLRGMCDAIEHRGPDEEGTWVVPGVALGMRRLSVMDPAGGHQPMRNESGTVQLVFNGEIYNFRELRRQLVARGHELSTSSDTEVIAHLYEDQGVEMVHSLRGMFAIALWDSARSELLLARDRVGIKPLFYWPTPGGVAFASELRSFLTLPDFPARVNPEAVAQYLTFGYVPEAHCIFEGVSKLPPGHRLLWSAARGARVERYWSADVPVRVDVSAPDAIEELRHLLRESVELHLAADVPLGAFLSGGIDSSAVVAQMAQLVPGRVKTFSIGFDEASHNEAPHAAAVAREIGTEHTELIVRPDADALIESVITGFDEPFGDSSALPTFLVSQMARERVTVALSGDGGDELFGGYTRYGELLARRELPPLLRRITHAVATRLPHGALGRNRLLDLARPLSGRYAATVAAASSVEEGGFMSRELGAMVPPMQSLLAERFGRLAGRDLLAQMTAVDLETYLPGDILTKVDRMSMSVSLEARVPLLDHHIVEFAASIPSELKWRDGTGKWLLREAIRGLVPPRVLTHPKQGFGVPLARWFREPLRHRLEALRTSAARIREYVDEGALARLIDEHGSGRRDHSHVLWRLLALEVWLEALESGRLARPSQLARRARVGEVIETVTTLPA